MNKVDVLLDRKRNEISITTIDDTTSEEVETTLSVAEAWSLVAEINEALQKLALAAETRIQIVGNAKLNKDQLAELGKALEKSQKAFDVDLYCGGSIAFNVDARGASPEQTEAAVHRAMAKNGPAYPAHINVDARSTNPVPKSTHRPYSGTMNT